MALRHSLELSLSQLEDNVPPPHWPKSAAAVSVWLQLDARSRTIFRGDLPDEGPDLVRAILDALPPERVVHIKSLLGICP